MRRVWTYEEDLRIREASMIGYRLLAPDWDDGMLDDNSRTDLASDYMPLLS